MTKYMIEIDEQKRLIEIDDREKNHLRIIRDRFSLVNNEEIMKIEEQEDYDRFKKYVKDEHIYKLESEFEQTDKINYNYYQIKDENNIEKLVKIPKKSENQIQQIRLKFDITSREIKEIDKQEYLEKKKFTLNKNDVNFEEEIDKNNVYSRENIEKSLKKETDKLVGYKTAAGFDKLTEQEQHLKQDAESNLKLKENNFETSQELFKLKQYQIEESTKSIKSKLDVNLANNDHEALLAMLQSISAILDDVMIQVTRIRAEVALEFEVNALTVQDDIEKAQIQKNSTKIEKSVSDYKEGVMNVELVAQNIEKELDTKNKNINDVSTQVNLEQVNKEQLNSKTKINKVAAHANELKYLAVTAKELNSVKMDIVQNLKMNDNQRAAQNQLHKNMNLKTNLSTLIQINIPTPKIVKKLKKVDGAIKQGVKDIGLQNEGKKMKNENDYIKYLNRVESTPQREYRTNIDVDKDVNKDDKKILQDVIEGNEKFTEVERIRTDVISNPKKKIESQDSTKKEDIKEVESEYVDYKQEIKSINIKNCHSENSIEIMNNYVNSLYVIQQTKEKMQRDLKKSISSGVPKNIMHSLNRIKTASMSTSAPIAIDTAAKWNLS